MDAPVRRFVAPSPRDLHPTDVIHTHDASLVSSLNGAPMTRRPSADEVVLINVAEVRRRFAHLI